MQGYNWIFIAAVSMGIIFAVFGCRRGFYVIWAVLFNLVISIYLSVMFSPTVAAFLPGLFGEGVAQTEGRFWYAYAGLAAAVAVVSFVVLQIIAMTYFTGTFQITLPRWTENIGAAFTGFATGYILWGFICFLILIMPVSEIVFFKSFTTSVQSKELSVPAVSKVVNTVNALSLQPNRERVRNVLSWTLGWDVKEPNEPNEPI
jgi:hypothetical protein